jgi:hypothetical protein
MSLDQEIQERVKWTQGQIVNIMEERTRRGHPGTDMDSIAGAVYLLEDIRLYNALLDLFYDDKITLKVDENEEVQMKVKSNTETASAAA